MTRPGVRDARSRLSRDPAIETDVLVLGGGVSGLACGVALGGHAIVLEREDRPGGLVRGFSLGEYTFDRVLHLLYFSDEATEARVRALPDLQLEPCPPSAWVEVRSGGRARFPVQNHLGDLPEATRRACLADLLEASAASAASEPADYRELLQRTFGRALCEEFFFPYNEKMWGRPLESLATRGFHWNIAKPDLDQVRAGAVAASRPAYNARGWYPRPVPGGPRGMEALSHALAARVTDLRLGAEVLRVDLRNRRVLVRRHGRPETVHYRHALVSTIPLRGLLERVEDLPEDLRFAAARLRVNRVLSACFGIEGPRPRDTGHWRYFADPALGFTRLVFMHEFAPGSSPAEGWGLMAEIPEPSEAAPRPAAEVLARARRDLERIGIPGPGSRIVGQRLVVNDHGYVVFEIGVEDVVRNLIAYLREHQVEPLGRYGRWEYSSMSQVMRDGFAVGDRLRETIVRGASVTR